MISACSSSYPPARINLKQDMLLCRRTSDKFAKSLKYRILFDILLAMSESYPGESSFPEKSMDADPLYQSAALELLSICHDQMHKQGKEAEPCGDISGGYQLEPPASYDLPEWDCIDVEIFPEGSKDGKGNERIVRIEFFEDLNEDISLIERYTLLHNGERFKLVRRFRLMDRLEADMNKMESNISDEEVISKNGISWLNDTLFLCRTEEYIDKEDKGST
jgi:hypothetical protein